MQILITLQNCIIIITSKRISPGRRTFIGCEHHVQARERGRMISRVGPFGDMSATGLPRSQPFSLCMIEHVSSCAGEMDGVVSCI
jgi:hypothetical protein